MAGKHMKASPHYIIRKMQIKTIMRYTFTSTRMVKIKKKKKVGEE